MNTIYNIINYEDSQMLFNYIIIFVVFILLFKTLEFNMMILVGLFFASIIVYYWYTYRIMNNLTKDDITNDKFEIVNPNSYILKTYPDFVDFLFYIEDFKKFDISNYNKLVELFQNFSKLNNACTIDNNFIDDYYNTMNNIKYNIVDCLGKYNYTTNSSTFSNKINNSQTQIETILNNYMDKLITIQKNKIKKNGYNNKTKILDTTNILPYNYLECCKF